MKIFKRNVVISKIMDVDVNGGKGKLDCGKNDKSGYVAVFSARGKTYAKAQKNAKKVAHDRADKERKKQVKKNCPKKKCKIKTEKKNKTKNAYIRGLTLKKGNWWYANAKCEWNYIADCNPPKKKKTSMDYFPKKQRLAHRKRRR